MNIIRKSKRRVALLAAIVIPTVSMAACDIPDENTSNPAAMCSYIIGNGKDGHDSKVHEIVYPDFNVGYDENSEVARYVPCNSRNFLINDGTKVNANNERVGDRFTPSVGYTKQGTQINVYTSAYWTLNQSDDAMRKFWELCYKYTCASSDSSAGAANFSTPGWNGMLGENFGPTIDQVILEATAEIDDAVWQKHDPKLYDELSKRMSELFAGKMRARTGYDVDLFCGSGNSGWTNPNKPGEGEFTCTNVRFVVDVVDAADAGVVEQANEQTQTQLELAANQQRYDAAVKLYGDLAAYWLGLQDTIKLCNESGSATCVINIPSPNGGDDSTPPVVVAPSTGSGG